MTRAAESGHWYDKDGEPRYTTVGANGNERNTTLRDARKLNLVPSVTTILNVAAKPGLERWKIDQALMAALTLPMQDGESLDAFKARALSDSKEQARKAAERGTMIHAYLQGHFEGEAPPEDMLPFVEGAVSALDEAFGPREWIAEQSFCHPLGYGGKVDLHCEGIVVDFKTKEFGASDELKAYDEQVMQCKAYAHGLNMPDAITANVFVSVNNPGLAQVVVHPEGTYFDQFCKLLEFWQLSKGYKPEIGE